MARAGKRLRETSEEVLAKRDGGSEDGDLLGRLVTARDPATGSAMPARLIVDNVVTFLMAGHETTSRALTWTLYLLALFPEWQERVREEVRRVAGGEETGRDDIGKLQLLDAVLEEFELALDDDLGDPQDRLPALIDVVDEELRPRHVLADVLPIFIVHRHRARAFLARGLHLHDQLAVHRIHAERKTP